VEAPTKETDAEATATVVVAFDSFAAVRVRKELLRLERLGILRTLGGRLRSARQAYESLTQDKLGVLSNSNQATVQKIENGHSHMPRCIKEYAAVLDVNPAWLLFGSRFAPIHPQPSPFTEEAWA